MKSLIVGMGIGNLYHAVLTDLGHEIITVDADPAKNADYKDVKSALKDHKHFDTAHICTPNFTHRDLAEEVAPQTSIVFVEKPGFNTAEDWQITCEGFPNTRFMMVKNNMWRDNIKDLARQAHGNKRIELLWHNKNRIPSPGSWFTTKKLAFGGVSRDLMPHLLSFLVAFEPDVLKTKSRMISYMNQAHDLKNIKDTEYGVVNSKGTLDVDTESRIAYYINGRHYYLSADWKNDQKDDRAIHFSKTNVYEFGLCPESAYLAMIRDAIKHKDDDRFWKRQLKIDLWIHKQIES
jgi:predicted dehydrogenase